MKRLDPQLRWITDLLQKNEIPYWIDSGTLLGLKREGKLLEWDKDVDLGVWVENAPQLLDMKKVFRKVGYKVRLLRYAGHVFKIKLEGAGNKGFARSIDINLFDRAAAFAWCPQPIRISGLGRSELFAKLRTRQISPGSRLGLLLDVSLRIYFRKFRPSVAIDKFPWTRLWEAATWWIPKQFFEEVVVDEVHQVMIPSAWEDYLSLRYGDWRKPARNWTFQTDDKGLVRISPTELVHRVSSPD